MVTTAPKSVVSTARTVVATRSAAFWLAIVAAAYTVVMFIVVVPLSALGADESVYASQVNPRVPPLKFSAPRARGITYLIAPILHVTSSTVAMRAFLALLAGLLLVAAYWPWLRVLEQSRAVPLAALVFASLWVTLFYGADDMPNAWVAFAAVATVGWFVRYGADPQRRSLAGVTIGMAVLALLRPGDALWIAVPLVLVMLGSNRWRRWPLLAAVLVGTAGGMAQWVVEAYARFGGPIKRLHAASAEQGGLAWHPRGLLDTLRSLAGPRLCRPCSPVVHNLTHTGTALFTLWWFALALLGLAGALIAKRVGRWDELAIPTACAAALALIYLLTVNYAAPRFLLPAYGLAAIPAAFALTSAAQFRSVRVKRATIALAVLGIATNAVCQLVVLDRQTAQPDVTRYITAGMRAPRIDRPCVLSGTHTAQLAYVLGCQTLSPRKLHRFDGHATAFYVTERRAAPARFAGWHRHQLRQPSGLPPLYAFFRPSGGNAHA